MRTVRFMLVATVALLIAVPATAQDKPKRKPTKLSAAAQAMLRMSQLWENLKKLELTGEQKEKLKAIHEETGPKMKAILEKMKGIVTEEQRAAVEEAAKKAKEAGKEGRALFVAVESSIQLTDEQKEKLDKVAPEIRAVQRQMMKGIMGILTPEQQEKMKKMRPTRKKKAKKAD